MDGENVVETTLADQREYLVQAEASIDYSGIRTVKDGNTEFENDKHGVDSERNYAYLWGVNTRGQLGTGDNTHRSVPAAAADWKNSVVW